MDRLEEVKLRIKEATDLVTLIEGYLPLKQKGRDYMARCPFHQENTASFSVSREKQFFHCFGCGKNGDVFTWLMERDGLGFREAVEVLADRVGISLEGVFGRGASGGGDRRDRKRGPDPFKVLAEVAGFLGQQLMGPQGKDALEYLVSRGLEDAIEPWQLGYHPERRGSLTEFARERKLPRQVLEDAGLLKNGNEAFAGRIIFPIADERGRIVAFGGRVVPGSRHAEGSADFKPPKYLNSPESPIFNKRRVLFGLPHVKRAGERKLLVMEGYTDVIACHLAGFRGAVATLGTAFTTDHARLVERYASDGIVLMFDGDRAGRNAAAKAMRELVNSRLSVRMAVMSDAGDGIKDPADLVALRPGDDPELVDEQRVRFADIVDSAEDSLTVWFRLLRDRLDLSDAVNVEAAAGECVEILQVVENPVKQAALRQAMASHLAVPEPTFERLLARAPRRRMVASERLGGVPDGPPLDGEFGTPEPRHHDMASGGHPELAPEPVSLRARGEVELLACVLADPTLLEGAPDMLDEAFEFGPVRELLGMVTDGLGLGRNSSNELVKYLFTRVTEAAGLRSVLATAARRSETIPDAEALWRGLRDARSRQNRKPELRQLRQEFAQAMAAGDRERADALQAQLLAAMRQDRPRKTDPGPVEDRPKKGPPPRFGVGSARAQDSASAAAAAAGDSPDGVVDPALPTSEPLPPEAPDSGPDS